MGHGYLPPIETYQIDSWGLRGVSPDNWKTISCCMLSGKNPVRGPWIIKLYYPESVKVTAGKNSCTICKERDTSRKMRLKLSQYEIWLGTVLDSYLETPYLDFCPICYAGLWFFYYQEGDPPNPLESICSFPIRGDPPRIPLYNSI